MRGETLADRIASGEGKPSRKESSLSEGMTEILLSFFTTAGFARNLDDVRSAAGVAADRIRELAAQDLDLGAELVDVSAQVQDLPLEQ